MIEHCAHSDIYSFFLFCSPVIAVRCQVKRVLERERRSAKTNRFENDVWYYSPMVFGMAMFQYISRTETRIQRKTFGWLFSLHLLSPSSWPAHVSRIHRFLLRTVEIETFFSPPSVTHIYRFKCECKEKTVQHLNIDMHTDLWN